MIHDTHAIHTCTLCLQSKEMALDIRVVYVYMKSRIFGRGKLLIGPEAAAKLQVSIPNLLYSGKFLKKKIFMEC